MAFTQLYLAAGSALAPPFIPTNVRGAWDDTASAVTRMLDPLKRGLGTTATQAVAETNAAGDWDVLLYRGVSGPLDAQTITGTVDVRLQIQESNADANFVWHVHIYVTAGDTDTVRGTLLADYIGSTEWPTTLLGRGLDAAQTLTNIGAITAGDRLVVEIGYRATNTHTTSRSGSCVLGTMGATNGTILDDVTVGGGTGAPYLLFSNAINELPAGRVRVSQAPLEYVLSAVAAARVSQVAVEVVAVTPLPEGGEVPPGTNPPAASIPSTTPQFFGVLEAVDDGTIVEAFSEAAGGPFADPSTYFGGFKERRILSFGTITRKVTTPAGGIQLSSQQVVLDDADRYFRASWATTTRRGRKWSNYVVEHGTRLALGEPFRLSGGLVTDHAPLDDFTYQLTVEGMLGRHIARPTRAEAMAPPNRLTPDLLPALLSSRFSDGWSPPIGYGLLDDEAAAQPQGVVPGQYVGTANLQTIFGGGAVNIAADFFVFFGHAVQDTLNLYFTPPGWTASTAYLAGDVVRPNLVSNGYLYQCVAAGTSGSSAPAFSTTIGATFSDGGVTWQNIGADDPDLRYRVPAAAYGQIIADPHKPGWAAVTGGAPPYVDWNGYRFHVAVVRSDHRFAKALREGRMTLSGNFRGIEDAGDGTGALLTAPARIFQHFWVNFVENSYKTGAWFGMPAFGAYSLFDTTTVEAVTTYTETLVSGGPVRASILIGAHGRQLSVFEVVKQMASSWDLKLAENRHGQIVVLMDNPSAAAAATFTAQDDTLTLTTAPRRAGYANVVRYRYGYRWVPPVATQLEGEQGQPMPAQAVHEHADWVSGLIRLTHASAIAQNNDQEEVLDLDLYGVRDAATAAMYAARVLARAVGPTAALEGPIGQQVVTGLQGLQQGATVLDQGTMIGLDHIEGLGASGYIGAKFLVDEVTVEPDTCRVRLVGDLQA